MKDKMKETLGFTSGTVATVTLANVNLFVGICAGLLTIICLLPSGVKNWREMREQYEVFKESYIGPTRFLAVRYAFGLRLQKSKTPNLQSGDDNGGNI